MDRVLTGTQVVVRILETVAAVELLVMGMLSMLPSYLSWTLKSLLDVILLTMLLTPLIIVFVIKPFVKIHERARDELRDLAQHDPLTRLPNRRLLANVLSRTLAACARHKTYGALLFIDLDGFKRVNDTFGHDAGDEVLIETAGCLLSVARAEDFVSRLGGDEFVVLIDGLGDDVHTAHAKALGTAARLQERLKKPISYKGETLQVGSSIGIRLLGGKKLGADAAIKESDMAMYISKQAGGGRIVFFDEGNR